MATVIFHNPDCGTSRNVLGAIIATGTTPIVIEYLNVGWTRPQLQALFAVAGLTARDALRVSKTPAEDMGLTDSDVGEDALLDAMVAHPILVNRPIVCTPKGVALCRPSEAVLPLLEIAPTGPLLKEDGTPYSIDPEPLARSRRSHSIFAQGTPWIRSTPTPACFSRNFRPG